MKNSTPFIPPLFNIERNPLVLLVFSLLSILLIIANYEVFRQMNPLGFMLIIPSSLIFFQTLWFFVNPFALVYEDKIFIKYSLFKNKEWYYIDISKISTDKNGRLIITYKDGEMVQLNVFGIKPAHLELLKKEIEKNIS